MKLKSSFVLISLAVLMSGCAHMRAGQEVQAGRQLLLSGNPEKALGYFQSAAQQDPNYLYGTALRHGVWSYVGRSEYAAGNYPQARQSLEKALSINSDEGAARLYLGLTLARTGDRQRGLTEIENGMKNIYDWIEYIAQTHRFSFGQYWDPAHQLRKAIQTDLATISRREFDWDRLITSGEWIGNQIEEEIDRARYDESRDRNRDSSGRDNPL